MVYKSIGEPIQVYALFTNCKIKPISFKWSTKVYKVSKVTQTWNASAGKYKLHHFGVIDTEGNFFQLCYSEEDFSWTLIQTWE
ncbi:hypothetical protein A2V56_03735 [Candidatus Woesebacteria bacterium RBG_19FT_COMBO_42_9]|nr:MAG: hypothetical protein A2V56_03735 [Candidatus Woesebacteria bacterium RBG_19FT_COMBO_42_9]